ncbi:MAG: HlyD family efflux transporter periplasmic adaptor subunit [Lachnospiraceae bacterium]|nr:HlyD family efflux transporter periplasmic adaptor subunit [Lachnospiraceae bacterium]
MFVMNENVTSKRREWVKNAAIIFLSVMLILTFFSNTIMNYSLPEVATKYVEPGTITAKVRGTGNVEATDPYNVMVTESRVISAVAVQQGDYVEKDQVIYYLEDTESDELETARDELEELELAYMKGLFGGTVSSDVINKVASGNTDSFATYQSKVTDMQTRLEAAEARVKECQDVLNALTLQSAVSTNNATVNTIPDELEKADASTDLANAEAAFQKRKDEKIADINAEILEIQNQINDLETLIESSQTMSTGNDTGNSSSAGTGSTSTAYDLAKINVKAKLSALDAIGAPTLNGTDISESSTEAEAKAWYNDINWSDESFPAEKQLDCEAKYGEYRVAVDELNAIAATLEEYGSGDNRQAQLERLKETLTSLEAELAEVNAITVASSGSVQEAQNRLNQANQNITEISAANKQSSVSYQNKILNAEAALKNAQAVLTLLQEEQKTLASDINAQLDLTKASKDIADKKEEIAKLEAEAMGAAVTAPVAGTVTSLAYVAGETTKPEQPGAVIQVAGKGFTVSFSVTNEQATKVKVGDTAELQNAWYYDDVQVILSAIKPDPESMGQKKLLVFDVTGSSITAGQTLNISVGQRSAEYEFTVPNSAVREDSNGKFILIVESKSSPLGNRYIATRVDVEVLASDDNNSAISAGLYGYEYVITTSTKPVEAGKQVRLSES